MKYLKVSLIPFTVLLVLLVINCTRNETEDSPSAKGEVNYKAVLAFADLPAFNGPVELTGADDGTNRLFVIEQKGVIRVFVNDIKTKQSTVFLDISSKVSYGGEAGLLGLAFHPDFKTNGYFYVNYMRKTPLRTVISRFKVNSGNPNIADVASEEELLTYEQPYDNHNGGKLAFGNDKLLYISAGDGGSWGDPHGNGQNKSALLGKILRIDVDHAANGKKYAIPADNPFKGNTHGFKEEIYAYGMRNPWRFSFDKVTGQLWVGDVGQNQTEEIDIIEKGGNYGWNIMEANDCYKSGNCDKTGLSLPIYTYGRSLGTSITGGYVCRDKNLPGLTGKYIYGDYTSGNVWALSFSGAKATSNSLIANVGTGSLSSFGQDNNGDLYLLNYQDGRVYKLVADK